MGTATNGDCNGDGAENHHSSPVTPSLGNPFPSLRPRVLLWLFCMPLFLATHVATSLLVLPPPPPASPFQFIAPSLAPLAPLSPSLTPSLTQINSAKGRCSGGFTNQSCGELPQHSQRIRYLTTANHAFGFQKEEARGTPQQQKSLTLPLVNLSSAHLHPEKASCSNQ